MIVVAHPVVVQGIGAVGLVIGYCELSVLDRIMAEPSGLGQTGESFLVGSDYSPLTRLRFQNSSVVAKVRLDEGVKLAVGTRIHGQGLYRDYRDVPVIGAYSWLPILEVALIVEQDQSEAFGPVLSMSVFDLVVALVALLLAMIASTLITRGIAAPLHTLSATATRIASGDLEHVSDLRRRDEIGRLAEAFDHMTGRLRDSIKELKIELEERRKAETQLRESSEELRVSEARNVKALVEKESLLRELHHRTKNNMAVIIALLDLKAIEVDDERLGDIIGETQNRIRAMALVHEKLYDAPDLSRISLKEYILDLVALLCSGFLPNSAGPKIVSELEDVPVLIDSAIPCGLILNELITNSLKHAFPDARAGTIRLGLRSLEGGEILFSVADDGVGFPPGFDHHRDSHMGLQTVVNLGEKQLAGSVRFDTSGGVACEVRFRDNLYQARV